MPGPSPKQVKSQLGSREDNRRTQVLGTLSNIPVPAPGSAGNLLQRATNALQGLGIMSKPKKKKK